MPQIDLDDLPQRIPAMLAGLAEDEELVLVQAGAVVARLTVAQGPSPQPAEPLPGLTPEAEVHEVLDQFSAMINDEF